MQRLIILIIVIFAISQIIGRVKRSQQKDQRKREPLVKTPIRLPWEFEIAEETPTPEERVEVKMPREQPRKVDVDDEFSGDEHIAVSDEESFSDKTAAQVRPSEPEPEKPSVPSGHKPAQIAGIPINTKTISQGIIISEILRRPRF